MAKVLILTLLIGVLLYGGVVNTYNFVRYRTPPTTTLAATPARSLPTFVTLKDITFDVDHLLKLKIGSEILFIPVRAKGVAPNSPYDVVVQTSAAELIAAVNSKSPEALRHLAALAVRTEVTGRVNTTDSRRMESLRKELPLVSPDAVLLDEGATPAPIQGGIMLAMGLGLCAIALGGGFKTVAPAASPAAAGAPNQTGQSDRA